MKGGGCHWHVDYLLTLDPSRIDMFFKSSDDHECRLSRETKSSFKQFEGFGCSDCDCSSHLFYSKEKEKVVNFLERFYNE